MDSLVAIIYGVEQTTGESKNGGKFNGSVSATASLAIKSTVKTAAHGRERKTEESSRGAHEAQSPL
jgi:hypothetical protein